MESTILNRKNPRPSDSMLPPDGSSYRCRWLEDGITVHADGNVSCGLDDPHGARSFGNVTEQSVEQIFANPEYAQMQERLAKGSRCNSCGLYEKVEDGAKVPRARKRLPTTLVVEPTIKCNLRCPQPACIPNNEPGLRTRDKAMLSEAALARVLEEIGRELKQVYFFNYGEPFVHRGAEAMLANIKERAPAAEIVTSTNGIPLKKYERAENVVRSGLDFMTFTISGMTQESYEKYHVGGRLEDALSGLKNVVAAKHRLGSVTPEIVWRYLLFRWTDDEAEVAQAVELAEQLNVRLSLYLTDVPDGAASWKFAPGTPLFERYQSVISSAYGYTVGEIDSNGFYRVEDVEGLGPARWTSYRARRAVHPVCNTVQVALSTNRPDPVRQSATIAVPWGKLNVALMPGRWLDVAIEVPASHSHCHEIEVRFSTDQPWHPADILGNRDLRLLGMLVEEPPAQLMPHAPGDWGKWQEFSGLGEAHAGRFDGFEEVPSAPSERERIGNGSAGIRASEVQVAAKATYRRGASTSNSETQPQRENEAAGITRVVYNTLLGRDPDEQGAATYESLFEDESTARSLSKLLTSVTESVEFQKIWRARVALQSRHYPDKGNRAILGKPISHVASLGCDCTSSFVIKDCGLKRYSLPFDWIFSSPGMVLHCINDDFSSLLERRHFRSVTNSRENREPGADHLLFLEKFGILDVFAHRDPTRPDHYAYLERCVQRIRDLFKDDAPKLFFMLCKSGQSKLGAMFAEIVDTLARVTKNAELIAIQLQHAHEGSGQCSLAASEAIGGNVLYNFTPSSDVGSRGYFPDPVDQFMLIRLLAQYDVNLAPKPA